MKKAIFICASIMIGLSSCSGNNNPPESKDMMWVEEYSDGSVFRTENDVLDSKVFIDGNYEMEESIDFDSSKDNKLEFYNDSSMRYVDKSNGFALTFSGEKPEIDYTLGKYGVNFNFKDAKLRLTREKNHYDHNESGYRIYVTEWLDRYINNPQYLKDNNLTYSHKTIYEDSKFLDGYIATVFSIKINDLSDYYPYYNIALMRKKGNYSNFTLLVYKSKTDGYEWFTNSLKTYKEIDKFGSAKHYVPRLEPKKKDSWNEETKNYYDKLQGQHTLDFGVFSASLCSDNDSSYDYIDNKVNEEKTRLESAEGISYTYEIMPTYTHISWYDQMHYFPNKLAEKYAGGNGFNDKPVLQFTYQFTTNNNKVSPQNLEENYTPMFDILRGTYDAHFTQLANDIKNYKHPVLFRLNNEMNTDWTSYSGIMTLIDPDIFIETWKHLYNIFDKVGVDNCLWIFNPIHTSCPYSNWGEDLPYFPGTEYVDLLGLTSYEMNNGDPVESFRTKYLNLYNKNKKVFKNYMSIISEFACGSGGETSGELHRNKDIQAKWVEDMFKEFKNFQGNQYLQNIKGAVWFGVNDYEGDKISNCLELTPELDNTLEKFREGFKLLEDNNENV